MPFSQSVLCLLYLFLVAPYGQDDLGNLRSIFEVKHLHHKVIFLDTQCKHRVVTSRRRKLILMTDRMPVPIGAFISRHVYAGKLQSCHQITAVSSCRFKDVRNGQEALVGGSWAVSSSVISWLRVLNAILPRCRTRKR